ncbi:MAG: response regulator [Steroidobacteraceae bacterium]|jgi:CheY-like chemotaxis protein/HPt (histidine-containing phosphotransfer) domain-containing protein|nr:response regulator [Steroidobacteraceae bacterium]
MAKDCFDRLHDEIGTLLDGCEALLARLESRDADLRRRRATLEEQVRARTAGSEGAPAAMQRADALAGVRVLLVDDNRVNQQLAGGLLASLGCEATLAGNGAEALALMSSQRFDAVLMDCQMPVMDGLAAAAAWRARERESGAPRLPIIALTASALPGDREACLGAGMDEHLAKPFDALGLRDALLRVIQAVPVLDAGARRTATRDATADPECPVFEPSALAGIAALDPDGRRGLVPRIVGLFVQDSTRQLELLEAGLRAGDAAAAGRAMHSLKSSAANVGGRALSQAAALAEKRALAGDLAGVAEWLGTLRGLRDGTVAELRPLAPHDAA